MLQNSFHLIPLVQLLKVGVTISAGGNLQQDNPGEGRETGASYRIIYRENTREILGCCLIPFWQCALWLFTLLIANMWHLQRHCNDSGGITKPTGRSAVPPESSSSSCATLCAHTNTSQPLKSLRACRRLRRDSAQLTVCEFLPRRVVRSETVCETVTLWLWTFRFRATTVTERSWRAPGHHVLRPLHGHARPSRTTQSSLCIHLNPRPSCCVCVCMCVCGPTVCFSWSTCGHFYEQADI